MSTDRFRAGQAVVISKLITHCLEWLNDYLIANKIISKKLFTALHMQMQFQQHSVLQVVKAHEMLLLQ